MNELKYYKPKFLIIGMIIFGVSLISFGYLIGSQNDGGISIYLIVLSLIGFFIGEGFICEASSYKKLNQKEEKIK